MQAPSSIFEAVQEACDRSVWSRGVELARGENVQVDARDRHEIVLRVVTRAGRVAPEIECAVESTPVRQRLRTSKIGPQRFHVAGRCGRHLVALRELRECGERARRALRYDGAGGGNGRVAVWGCVERRHGG